MAVSRMKPFPSRMESALEQLVRVNEKILEQISLQASLQLGDSVLISKERYEELLAIEESYTNITSDEWIDNIVSEDSSELLPDKTDDIKTVNDPTKKVKPD